MKTAEEVYYDIRWSDKYTHADDVHEYMALEMMEAHAKQTSIAFAEWLEKNYVKYVDEWIERLYENCPMHTIKRFSTEQLYNLFTTQQDKK